MELQPLQDPLAPGPGARGARSDIVEVGAVSGAAVAAAAVAAPSNGCGDVIVAQDTTMQLPQLAELRNASLIQVSTPQTVTPTKKGKGRGLGWLDDELVALCKAELIAGSDPIAGAGMKQAMYFRRLKAEFVKMKPVEASSLEGMGCS